MSTLQEQTNFAYITTSYYYTRRVIAVKIKYFNGYESNELNENLIKTYNDTKFHRFTSYSR